jgi:hypothetical protein
MRKVRFIMGHMADGKSLGYLLRPYAISHTLIFLSYRKGPAETRE